MLCLFIILLQPTCYIPRYFSRYRCILMYLGITRCVFLYLPPVPPPPQCPHCLSGCLIPVSSHNTELIEHIEISLYKQPVSFKKCVRFQSKYLLLSLNSCFYINGMFDLAMQCLPFHTFTISVYEYTIHHYFCNILFFTFVSKAFIVFTLTDI